MQEKDGEGRQIKEGVLPEEEITEWAKKVR